MKKYILKIIAISIFIIGASFANSISAEPIQPSLSLYFETDLISGSISYNGSVQITWRPVNTTFCIATGGSNGWSGDRSMAGNFITGPLTATTTYSMTCSGGLGTAPVTKSVTVSVAPASSRRTSTAPSASGTNLSVFTDDAYNITYTTAILRGHRDLSLSSGLPTTAYFRYSKASISPIFCNDIYGSNMISTKDIFLETTGSTSFYQPISNLIPDTTYYYCAILSDRDNIIYGGSSIVKSFHTSPYQTTIKTSGATSITSDSVVFNGTFSSIENVTTYFQYRKVSTDGTTPAWINMDKTRHNLGTDANGRKNSNVYGNISFTLSGLTPSTRYQFRAVATTAAGGETKTIYGSTLSFTTSSISTDEGGTGEGPNDSNNTRVCPSGWTGTYPNCTAPERTGTCPSGWTGTYPNCTANFSNNYNVNNGTWNSTNSGRTTGTWGNGIGSGTWISTSGTGGTGAVTWTSLGNGIGTWTSATGSGTWTTTRGTGGTGEGPNDSNNTRVCPTGWTGIYPNCTANFSNNYNVNNGTWNSTNSGRTTGTWGNGIGSGTWISTSGTGGTGAVTWTSLGNGIGTWTSATGSGTWTTTRGTGGTGTSMLTNLVLGQTNIPPNDAIVRYHEGIETVFTRQIIANPIYASTYGYQSGTDLQTFAWDLADQFARMFGYVNSSGKEIRVSFPDIAAYQLQLVGNNLTVYEYYDGKIVDIRNITTAFKNASGYEYYFTK